MNSDLEKYREVCDRVGQPKVVEITGLSRSSINQVYNSVYGADPTAVINAVLEKCGGIRIEKVPAGYMKDAQGRLVPEEMIKPVDRDRDRLVRAIFIRSSQISAQLADFKRSTMGKINAFLQLSADQYNVTLAGDKGNVTLRTYDGRYQIVKAVSERMEFSEQLQVAKQLIDECLMEWSEGGRPELRTVVTDAFQVDKKGKINTKRILGLRRLDIQDEKWKTAMDAISDSLMVTDSMVYLRVYERDDQGKYVQLSLDLSNA